MTNFTNGVEKTAAMPGLLQTPFIPGYSAGCSLKVCAAHPCQKHGSPETGNTHVPGRSKK
ncbi:hypothetical protein FO478_01325 [Heyndrickxia coagulans DSM 1 = ATCC 7050]|nr:hypothetical protein [Heyndrickxia coagulans DSM 1 = ATCC 7050]RGR84364.1 hypothetical protein DWY22_08900 [Heyndrickxia coagulans]RGR97665.1 hypothetical protein DWY16_10040 [Heyndrickxia coagulans]